LRSSDEGHTKLPSISPVSANKKKNLKDKVKGVNNDEEEYYDDEYDSEEN
jgi:hypothetical protein